SVHHTRLVLSPRSTCFFSTATPTTELYTLSLHDALPISCEFGPPPIAENSGRRGFLHSLVGGCRTPTSTGTQPLPRPCRDVDLQDRKSTRLNSSHLGISYAVFCLKKKKK